MADQTRFAEAYARLRADRSVQFDFPFYQRPDPPGWIEPLIQFLRWLSPAFPWLFWGLVVLVGLAALWAIVSRFDRFAWLRWRRKSVAVEPEWTLDVAAARASLAEAEALATAGCYAEAARLLLRHSVEEIGARRPQFLKPSLTARDIAAASALPDAARAAFESIAHLVEVSAFGSQRVTADAWARCRAAYGAFALPQSWARA